jgi:L-ascorbate metabolism protein UlaG (beta-lactamase superfamily)
MTNPDFSNIPKLLDKKEEKKKQQFTIQKLLHSCFVLQFQNCNENGEKTTILTDPFFGKDVPENFDVIDKFDAKPKNLPKIDHIFITHEHFDHCCKDAISYIVNRDNSTVFAPKTVINDLEINEDNKRPISVDDNFKLGKIEVSVLSSQHPQSRYPVGYLFNLENNKVYFAGDTHSLPPIKIDPDVAILPAGGTFTADIHEFIGMTRRLKCKYSIPMHYNTFHMIQIDTDRLKCKAEEKLKNTELVLLNNGDTFNYKF